jgi:SAM-dependent methyltransferase
MTDRELEPEPGAVDPERVRQFAYLLFGKLEGAVTSGMVYLGERLGLYGALAGAAGPLTSAELAERTGLHERWVREWAGNQAAAGLVESTPGPGADGGGDRFALTPEAVAVLVDASSPAHGIGTFTQLPDLMATLEELPAAFRTGLGFDYDSHGPEAAASVERSFEPWYQNFLLPVALPALDGVVERLQRGGMAIDVGCGAGVAVCLLAAAFPESEVHGFEISTLALRRAEARKAALGLSNAHFHDPRSEPLPDDHRADLVTTFDCIHDMTAPEKVVAAIRRSIADDGAWLLVDMKAFDTLEENRTRNPMASLMYGMSVLLCLSSSMSEPDGAGLGTLGLPESKARELAEDAGFGRFRRLDIEHPINAFYEIRP